MVLVPSRVFSFKKSSVVAFVVPLRVEIRYRFNTAISKTFKRGKTAGRSELRGASIYTISLSRSP